MSVLLPVVVVVLCCGAGIVHGQLSVDELFTFHSKHALSSPCATFQYRMADFRVTSVVYNDLRLDCESSSIILANREQASSSVCSNEIEYLHNLRIRFRPSSLITFTQQTRIQVNQIQLRGIELSSLDDFIHQMYVEHSYFRSRRALLINLEQGGGSQRHHLALATNGEMTFLVFLFAREQTPVVIENSIDLVFPEGNGFSFNRSEKIVWRIDQGYVRNPSTLPDVPFQLSKTRFTLFDNETFILYGTQSITARRFLVLVDDTRVTCVHSYILRCVFPILPWSIGDTHRPTLKVKYYGDIIFNASLTLAPRTRLSHVPSNFSLMNISAFEVTIDANLCRNGTLKSVFHLILHLWREDVNGTARYQEFVQNELAPINCGTSAPLGREIEQLISPISINDILSIHVDLIHHWFEQDGCRTEKTRIIFT